MTHRHDPGVAGAFLPALVALLLFAAELWLERRRLATGLLTVAVLLFVAIAVLAGYLPTLSLSRKEKKRQ